jgi:exonuclease VII small subunit
MFPSISKALRRVIYLVVTGIALNSMFVCNSFANVPIPNKQIWQNKKAEFGIPDGLSSVKMGDEYQKYTDGLENARKSKINFVDRIPIYDRLEAKLTTYISDMDKNQKKIKNFSQAKAYVEGTKETLKSAKQTIQSIVAAGTEIKNLIAAVKGKLAGFNNKTPKATFQSLWSEEIRSIGTRTPLLVQKDPVFSDEHKAFKTAISDMNNLISALNDSLPTYDATDAIAKIKKYIVDLEAALDTKGAW